METVLLCGRQNIALRGHRDSLTDSDSATSTGKNLGNFWALLQFRVAAGNKALENHLAHAAHNAVYTSPRIQNEIAAVLGDSIRKTILGRVKTAKFFSVIADEVTDISNKEQMSLVLRYVDPVAEVIKEDFIDFIECDTGVTGEALSQKIIGRLQALDLDLQYLRGQGYDEASNMSGATRGAAAIISRQYLAALYFHCSSHVLNLVVVKALDVTSVRNMMGTIERAATFFFAHHKRQKALERAIESTQPDTTKRKLKDLCRTRWVQRLEALDTFQQLLPSVVACMEAILEQGSSWSRDSLIDA